MRLLLLLSAFLTALTGAVTGGAAAAQPVEASVSVSPARQGVAARVAAVSAKPIHGLFPAARAWRAPAPLGASSAGRSFGERRRE